MTAVSLTLYLARRDRTGDEAESCLNIVDIRAETESWYQKGLTEGMEKAREACQAAIDCREEEWKAKLDEARRSWSETEAAVLADHVSGAIAALKSEIEETVARILRPLVRKALIEDALSQFLAAIGKLLSDEDAIRLKVCGPSDLISQLSERLPQNLSVTVTAEDTPEVTVFANKTIIETRLREWLDCIGVESRAPKEEG